MPSASASAGALLTQVLRCCVFLVLICLGCASRSEPPAEPAPTSDVPSDGELSSADAVSTEAPEVQLELRPLGSDVWTHVSFKDLPGYGRFPSNGLVIRGSAGAVLIDTAWGEEPTALLIDRVENQIGRVQGVIVTHWHDDRAGGLAEVHRRGIASFGLEATSSEAKRRGLVAPEHILQEQQPVGLGVAANVLFPGAGHTPDNLVVWLPEQRILFGGCLIRAIDSTTLGNTADANLSAWSDSVARLEREFPEAEIVVPGHGGKGGPELLAHTRRLAEGAGGTR